MIDTQMGSQTELLTISLGSHTSPLQVLQLRPPTLPPHFVQTRPQMMATTTLLPHSPSLIIERISLVLVLVRKRIHLAPQSEKRSESILGPGESETATSLDVPQSDVGNDVAHGTQEVSLLADVTQATTASASTALESESTHVSTVPLFQVYLKWWVQGMQSIYDKDNTIIEQGRPQSGILEDI